MHDHAPAPADAGRTRKVRGVLIGVLAVNLLVAGGKLAVGAIVGATSLLADGIHSLLDGASNVVGLIGLSAAARPPDAEHPYGHQRYETLAALAIALLIGAGLYEIIAALVENLRGGYQAPAVTWWAAGFVAVTIVINFAISRYEARQGDVLESAILRADSAHTFADGLAALAVLAAFVATKLGVTWADPVATVVVAGFVALTAWRILRENVDVLADGARLDPAQVRDTALAVGGVLGVHLVRSRGAADWVLVDLHVQVDGDTSVRAAHDLSHQVSDAIRARFPAVRDVVVHTEPADHDAPLAPGVEAG